MSRKFHVKTELTLRRGHTNRLPEPETITDKKMWCVVDGKHRPAVTREGFIMFFFRARDAERWVIRNAKNQTSWRVMPTMLLVTST